MMKIIMLMMQLILIRFFHLKDVPVIYVPGCSLIQENHNFPLSVIKIASKMKGGGGGGGTSGGGGKMFNNHWKNKKWKQDK